MVARSQTRPRMVETAARLLWAQGFHATGLQQILEESSAPKGSLYFHFPGGKEQLAAEAVRAAGGTVNGTIRKLFDEHDSVEAALHALVEMWARGLEKSEFQRGCPIATITLEAASKSDVIRAVCEEMYAGWECLITERLVREGWGETRAAALATVILSALEGALILARARRDVAPLRTVGAQMEALLRAQ